MERSSILSRGRSWLALEISADGFELPRAHSPAMSATSLARVTTASRVVPARRCASDVGASSRLAPPRRGASVASRAAVATAPATAGVDKAAARELVAWLTVEKGLPADAASQVSFGDGGAATLVSDARAGEPLIEIPRLAVTSVDVADSPIVSGLAAGRGELIGLALWLCHERAKGALSDWAPYIATLPGAGADHPLLWPEAEMNDLLQGSPAREEALSAPPPPPRSTPPSAPPSTPTPRTTPRATPTPSSPARRSSTPSPPSSPALSGSTPPTATPWYPSSTSPDRRSPSPGRLPGRAAGGPAAGKSGLAASAGVVDYDAATECVAVTSADDAQQTAKVVMVDPLARNSGDLFLATGAVDEDHCGDYLTMTASTVETDRLYSAKKQILEGMGMSADEQAFPVFADRMPLQLLAYMRFSRVQEPSELMTVSFEEDRIVSPMNEYEVLQLLMGDAREMLAEYENSSEEYELLQLKEKGLSARPADGGETAPGGEAAHQRHHHRGASPTGAHPRDSHQAGHGRSQR